MSKGLKKYKELEKPIIFIGNPRSGTSIISEIVMRHSDIGFPSQWQSHFPHNLSLNYLRRLIDNKYWRIHGQKEQLNKVSFFNKVVFRMSENYGMWNEITDKDIDFERGFLLNIKASDKSVEYLRSYFRKIVRNQGKKRLAFKITGPSKIEYLHSIFPDAKFIRIHRKPIPTISSLLKSAFWEELGAKKLWWTGVYSREEKEWVEKNNNDPVAVTAFQFKKVADVADYEIRKLDVDVLDVKYLNFIKNPEHTIKSILEYVELSIDSDCLSYFEKNKIYNRNKKDEEYFKENDLKTIENIFALKTQPF